MRGEGPFNCTATGFRTGRSPRARGRHRVPPVALSGGGSIPACAGKAGFARLVDLPKRVDPRVRGEGVAGLITAGCLVGRSPRARGRPQSADERVFDIRSIPACAGKAPAPAASHPTRRVDPRVRGEGLVTLPPPQGAVGRSPRARGRRSETFQLRRDGGSIPACAGKASSGNQSAANRKVDPRVRGEGTGRPPSTRPY